MKLGSLLVEEFKKQGLDLAEDGAKLATGAVFNVIKEVIKQDGLDWDDMLLPWVEKLEAYVLELEDKIDGQEG